MMHVILLTRPVLIALRIAAVRRDVTFLVQESRPRTLTAVAAVVVEKVVERALVVAQVMLVEVAAALVRVLLEDPARVQVEGPLVAVLLHSQPPSA
jgi:hypothetical protein